jgi:hypothetical protein
MLPQLVVALSSFGSHTTWVTGEEYTHVPLQCHSTSSISVAKNPVFHSKTNHIELRYHFLRDNVEKGKMTLINVPTHDQLADIFTKPLDLATFTRSQGELGVCLISWVGVWELLCSICIAFLLCISCIWHGICNMMYMHLCILGCMHFVSYALFRKSFSYIHCSLWCAIFDRVS